MKTKFKVDDFVSFNGNTYKILNIISALNNYKYLVRSTGNENQRKEYTFFKADEQYMTLLSDFKETFDLLTLKPYDKVLVRLNDTDEWHIDFFETIKVINNKPIFICMNHRLTQMIPYNKDTEHLVGSRELPPDFYINW